MPKILLSVFTFIALTFAVAVIAQETDGTPTPATGEERLTIETKDKGSPATKGLKLEKEYKPRLPAGYGPAGAAVDTAQRERILKILTEYNDVIAILEMRIELLKKERDAKMETVLTPAQQQKLKRPASARGGPLR
jgi:hypothetical protein